MQGLWKTWMTIWCGATLLFGVVLLAAAHTGTDAAARLFYGLIGGPDLDPAFLDAPAMRFTVGILGAVVIGWAMTIFTLVSVAGVANRPAWRGLTASIAIWYVIDSIVSITSGYPLNAASNTVFLVTYLVPVIASGVLGQSRRASTIAPA